MFIACIWIAPWIAGPLSIYCPSLWFSHSFPGADFLFLHGPKLFPITLVIYSIKACWRNTFNQWPRVHPAWFCLLNVGRFTFHWTPLLQSNAWVLGTFMIQWLSGLPAWEPETSCIIGFTISAEAATEQLKRNRVSWVSLFLDLCFNSKVYWLHWQWDRWFFPPLSKGTCWESLFGNISCLSLGGVNAWICPIIRCDQLDWSVDFPARLNLEHIWLENVQMLLEMTGWWFSRKGKKGSMWIFIDKCLMLMTVRINVIS